MPKVTDVGKRRGIIPPPPLPDNRLLSRRQAVRRRGKPIGCSCTRQTAVLANGKRADGVISRIQHEKKFVIETKTCINRALASDGRDAVTIQQRRSAIRGDRVTGDRSAPCIGGVGEVAAVRDDSPASRRLVGSNWSGQNAEGTSVETVRGQGAGIRCPSGGIRDQNVVEATHGKSKGRDPGGVERLRGADQSLLVQLKHIDAVRVFFRYEEFIVI